MNQQNPNTLTADSGLRMKLNPGSPLNPKSNHGGKAREGESLGQRPGGEIYVVWLGGLGCLSQRDSSTLFLPQNPPQMCGREGVEAGGPSGTNLPFLPYHRDLILGCVSFPLLLWKNRIQPIKSEDLIGFIEWFTNWAASHLAARKTLQKIVENGRFL